MASTSQSRYPGESGRQLSKSVSTNIRSRFVISGCRGGRPCYRWSEDLGPGAREHAGGRVWSGACDERLQVGGTPRTVL